MKNLSKKTLWIIVASCVILAFLLVYLCTITDDAVNKMIIVFLAIDFIVLTVVIQMASYKSFTYKLKQKDFPVKDYSGDYNELENLLIKNGYSKRKTSYGLSFLKIKGKNAYKAVLVDNYVNYFDNTIEEEKTPANKQLDKCERFVAVEIFKEIDEANLMKLTDFSLQGKKIYYTALLYQGDNKFKCLNYIEPNLEYKEILDTLYSDLNIVEIGK